MRRSDHILTLTAALLNSAHDTFQNALTAVKGMYELKEIRKPETVSLGAITDQEYDFEAWLLKLRKEQISDVKFFYAAIQHDTLAPHMAAAFAGSPDLLMQVKTADSRYTFKLETYFSPSYQITPQQFISVMQAQTDQKLVWSRVVEQVLESNRLNERTIFEPSEIVPYLQSMEGKNVFEFLATELIKEAQIECTIHGHVFIIPSELQGLFIKYPPLGFGGEDREYVYLYPLRDVSAEEILSLAETQSFEPQIWEELNRTLDEYQDETMKPMPVAQWKGKIMNMETEMLQRIVSPVCRSICKLCEERNLKPVIPAKLADAFGPDELGQKRAAARSKDDRWSLQPTQKPWEYYAFLELAYEMDAQVLSIDQIKLAFVHALIEIQAFAREIQSPFEEAFTLALFIEEIVDLNNLDQQIQAAGFSERATEVLNGRIWMVDQFKELGLSTGQIKGLLSISIADVFGGMGSWNDQYVEGDQERYQAVSANMYQAMKDHSAVLISGRM